MHTRSHHKITSNARTQVTKAPQHNNCFFDSITPLRSVSMSPSLPIATWHSPARSLARSLALSLSLDAMPRREGERRQRRRWRASACPCPSFPLLLPHVLCFAPVASPPPLSQPQPPSPFSYYSPCCCVAPWRPSASARISRLGRSPNSDSAVQTNYKAAALRRSLPSPSSPPLPELPAPTSTFKY